MPNKQSNEEEVLTPEAQAQIDALKAKIAEMEAQVISKDQHIAAQEKKLEKYQARGAGWLVSTQNPMYDGQTFGVQFLNGQAFIAKDRIIPQFVIPPLKDTQLAKMNEKERAVHAERSAIPPAQLCAEAMEHQFGYRIAYFDGSDDAALATLINDRAKERAEAQRIMDEQGVTQSGLIQPARIGVSR